MTLHAAIPKKNYRGSVSILGKISCSLRLMPMLPKQDAIALAKHGRDIRVVVNSPGRCSHACFIAPDNNTARNARVSLVRPRHPTQRRSSLERLAHAS